MNILTWLLLSALAAFRLAELFVIDDGPFGLFVNLRGWFNRTNANVFTRTIGDILTCAHCAGLYISLAFGIIYYFFVSENLLESTLFAFACAGLQSIISNKLGRTH